MLGKHGIHMQKKENRTLPHTCKNQPKIDDLTEEPETIKILKRKHKKVLCWAWWSLFANKKII